MITDEEADVTVIGGGLAGLAASIRLAKAGFRVICFEPASQSNRIVGESLDWSAPQLFQGLDLPMEDLVEKQVSTFKRHVTLTMPDGSETEYVPGDWLGRAPWNIELRTLHVDRLKMHRRLTRVATTHGVQLVRDRVVEVERTGGYIRAVKTAEGQRATSTWFLDASGSAASFLGRTFQLSPIEYGPKKVAIWTYLDLEDWKEGTTLYADAAPGSYMSWTWEIPVNPGKVSIGHVTTGARVKQARERGLSTEQILCEQLMKFQRFRTVLQSAEVSKVNVTSFSCRVYRRVCGPNWIIIGEAASVPDPITGNGVTAALRNASEAATLISRFHRKGRIPWWSQISYSLRVLHMGKFFNSLIEKLAYEHPIRDRMGLLKAGDAYTIPAWTVNQIYSRVRPDGLVSSALFSVFLSSLRCLAWIPYVVCKFLPLRHCTEADPVQ
jgi:flavin-dependent dehydrogenase